MTKKKKVSRLREDIMTRCYNPKSIMYEKYGGRGITVCEEWHDLEKFKEWAFANGFDGTQRIERVDTTKGYYPENCILSTRFKKKENSSNTVQTLEPTKKKLNKELPLGMYIAKNGRVSVNKSPLHGRYHSMRMRCENPKDKDYKFYGARGISVCEEWKGVGGEYRFIMWAAKSGYKEGLQLDRIDNNGGYSPDNCRWATVEEQQNNRRGNKLCKFNGEKKTIAEIARASKIPYNRVLYLINALGVETETVK